MCCSYGIECHLDNFILISNNLFHFYLSSFYSLNLLTHFGIELLTVYQNLLNVIWNFHQIKWLNGYVLVKMYNTCNVIFFQDVVASYCINPTCYIAFYRVNFRNEYFPCPFARQVPENESLPLRLRKCRSLHSYIITDRGCKNENSVINVSFDIYASDHVNCVCVIYRFSKPSIRFGLSKYIPSLCKTATPSIVSVRPVRLDVCIDFSVFVFRSFPKT